MAKNRRGIGSGGYKSPTMEAEDILRPPQGPQRCVAELVVDGR